MHELSLSNDLNQLELEITHHKNIAGQSVWEIGKRLNHVKTNNLTHGEFGKWLDKIKIGQREAQRMMKVSLELPNTATLSHLGVTALNLIASLPEEEREKEHVTSKGETKTPDEMTVRELQELKKQLSRAEIQLKISEQDNKTKQKDIDRLMKQNKTLAKEKEIVIEKHVIPDDYDATKEQNEHLKGQYKSLNDSYESIKKQYDELLDSRKEVEEKSMKYDEITQAIQKAEGKLNAQQKEIAAYRNLIDTTKEMNKFLDSASHLIYMDDMDILNQDKLAIDELERLLSRVDSWAIDLRKKLNTKVIIEGEFTHE
ncbi:DUF3102 domain-containing protein [Ruoffia tabacinasalis]|uniref:DUF3102 domain-containing protein n=1 Tax=Ruoffia tabacinasalis TaxID=87458 RepID=A0ABS0LGQ5_9LACT|nr:DUF3102 domain-containing protein [Ruoffia tabacinasalis]MBG9977254.1 DUF3102 domain-containing protein [Ruoffia tabacinasalis]